MTPVGTAGSQLSAAVCPGAIWIVDLDGVVWLAGEPIGDVALAVEGLRGAGVRVVFATNNSAPTTDVLVARLERAGIRASPDDLVTSADAAAGMLDPGMSVTVLAEGGVLEALTVRGVAVRDDGPVDAVIVGWTHTFDFDRLSAVAAAARSSGRLIGTNEDPTHPTPDGLVPGSGALLAAVTAASGVTPEIAGKPHTAMVDLIRARFGVGSDGSPVVMVGDQPRTDGKLAERLDVPFALVDSGVTSPKTPVADVPVAARAADFVTLVRSVLLPG